MMKISQEDATVMYWSMRSGAQRLSTTKLDPYANTIAYRLTSKCDKN